MNKDFEKIVRDMMKSGKSMKEVMDALGETWDQIEKSDAEKSVSDWRKEINDVFEERWRDQRAKIDSKIIVEFLFSVLSHKHPEWSLKDIQNGVEAVDNAVQLIEKAIGKNPSDMLIILERGLNDLIHGTSEKTRQKDTDSTKDKKCSSRFFAITDEDTAALNHFFKLFGL